MMLLDILEIDRDLSSEQRSIRDEVQKFIKSEVLPIIKEHHVQGSFPSTLIKPLAELGILKALSEGSLDPIAYGVALREIERAGSSLRSFLSVQGSLVLSAIQLFGSDSQKQQWVSPLANLEKIGCFALTEPDFGSNPSALQSRAEKTQTGFRIHGRKMWITNGTMADVAIVWARLEGKIRGFVVPTGLAGFESKAIKNKWSFRASDTAELFLDNVEVPKESLLEGSRSLGSALKCLNEARYGIAWGVTGAATACLEECLSYLKERIQFEGKPLASHQLIQNKLAWMATELQTMQLLAKQLGNLKTTGRLRPEQVSMAKMNNCRKALDIARTCRELLGAAGIHDEHHVGRHLVDLETVVTYEGTEHIHALVLGQHLTGISAFH